MARRQRYYEYYSGLVFDETSLTGDTGGGNDKYPVGLNLVKLLCLVIADSLFGEYEESPLVWELPVESEYSKGEELGAVLANSIMLNSRVAVPLWQVALDREIYGAGVIKISPDNANRGVKWTRVPVWSFYPVFDPDRQNSLLAAYVVTYMTEEQAELKYGLKNLETRAGVVERVEHWTGKTYTNTVGGKQISEYSGRNPWGRVPFAYIPRLVTTSPYGDSLTEDIIRPQDEANKVLRDLGESVNYNTHPTRWGKNIENFDSANFELGPNILWNLGTSVGDDPQPEVGVLEFKNAIPEGVMKYLDFVINLALHQAHVPGVAVGIDDSPGQTSGITLEQRMGNLIRSVRRSRSFFSEGLIEALRISGVIMRQRSFSGVSTSAVEALVNGRIVPVFANLLPRDQAAIVDEVQKGMSSAVPTISLATAVKKLGYGPDEVNKIMEMLQDPVVKDLFFMMNNAFGPKQPDARAAVLDG